MKKGIGSTLAVRFCGIDLDDVSRIEFVFKQEKRESAKTLKKDVFTADGSIGECIRATDSILVPWTKSETYKFRSGEIFYMDTRIEMNDSLDSPETPIVELKMCPTLFKEDEDG